MPFQLNNGLSEKIHGILLNIRIRWRLNYVLIHLSLCLALSKRKIQDAFHLAAEDLISRAKGTRSAASYRELTTPQAKMRLGVRRQFTKNAEFQNADAFFFF